MRPDIVAALAGDPVFRALARSHSARPQDAEDALQEAALTALTHGPDLSMADAARWFNTVLRRTCWGISRRERARAEHPMSALAGGPEADFIESLAGRLSTEGAVEAAEQLASLAAVPEGQRQPLLDLAAGFSYKEISARRGLSARQVERRIHNGRRRARSVAGVRTRAGGGSR